MTTRNLRLIAAVIVLAGAAGAYAFFSHDTAQAQPQPQATAQQAQAAAATAPAAGSTAASGKPLKDSIKPNDVYATVNGDKITGKDVQAFVGKLPAPLQVSPATGLLDMIVNQMVNDRLVAKEAAAEKIAEDAKTRQRISEATEQIIRDRFVEKRLEGKVTDAQVKAKYDELVKNAPVQEEMRARHILVKDQKTADEVLAKLKKGEDFAKLAKTYSIDPTKANGGDLGYFTRNAMVKEFGDAAFAMKKGQTSTAAIKTQFGYHIIQVVDRRPQVKPPYDAVKERIRAQLMEEQIRKLVSELRAKNKVEVTIPKA